MYHYKKGKVYLECYKCHLFIPIARSDRKIVEMNCPRCGAQIKTPQPWWWKDD